MLELNHDQIAQVSGGTIQNPILKGCMLSIPFMSALSGAVQGIQLSPAEDPYECLFNAIKGATIGLTAGLLFAVAADADPIPKAGLANPTQAGI